MKKLSDASYRLKGQEMFQILTKAKELERNGKSIIHFELGDPDFDTPRNIVDAACESLKRGDTHYVSSQGLFELKIAAADVTEKSRKFRPDLNQLLVTPGANSQVFYIITCVINPGEEVIVPDPGFVSYFSIIDLIGAKAVRVPLYEENEFRLNPNDVKNAITPNTKMIIINSPSNPTGAVMKDGEIEKIYKIAEKNDLYLLSDEVYARMFYSEVDDVFSSPSIYDRCKERTIVVNGFSKSYAMTGWRLGVVTGPANLVEKMTLMLETTTSCVAPFIQKAGIEALKGDQQQTFAMIKEYRKRRDLIVEGLNSIPGITCLKPKGAFYVFPNIKGTGMTDREFTDFMLEKAGVAVSPGSIFGKYGEGYIRLAYANSLENIEVGIQRMSLALQNR